MPKIPKITPTGGDHNGPTMIPQWLRILLNRFFDSLRQPARVIFLCGLFPLFISYLFERSLPSWFSHAAGGFFFLSVGVVFIAAAIELFAQREGAGPGE